MIVRISVVVMLAEVDDVPLGGAYFEALLFQIFHRILL
jgi:hypothetical protein